MSSGSTYEIKVPPLGESIKEATVGQWLKSVGDPVNADETLVELETDKVTVEVHASASGVLKEIRVKEGGTVIVGQILGLVEKGEIGTQSSPPATSAPEEPQTSQSDAKPSDFKLSSLKSPMVSMVSAPRPKTTQSSPSKPTPPPPQPAAGTSQKAPEISSSFDDVAPSVRKLAEELGVNPQNILGTGVGGRLTKEDILNAKDSHSNTLKEEESFYFSQRSGEVRTSDRREERVKMSRLRQRIAERLKQAQNTAAILTTFNEINMSAVSALRKEYKDSFEQKHGIKLGFMSFFVKACIQALKEFPAVNSEIDGDEIIYKNYYDIGVAVSTPQGLVVPVVRDADLLSFAELESQVALMAQKARDGKLTVEDLTGGTFTVSNGGIFGSLLSTPILNPPQTGILGMHKIEDRPVVIDGKIEICPMMYVALSYDHRVIDGRESVSFLVKVKEHLEKPEVLLLDM